MSWGGSWASHLDRGVGIVRHSLFGSERGKNDWKRELTLSCHVTPPFFCTIHISYAPLIFCKLMTKSWLSNYGHDLCKCNFYSTKMILYYTCTCKYISDI